MFVCFVLVVFWFCFELISLSVLLFGVWCFVVGVYLGSWVLSLIIMGVDYVVFVVWVVLVCFGGGCLCGFCRLLFVFYWYTYFCYGGITLALGWFRWFVFGCLMIELVGWDWVVVLHWFGMGWFLCCFCILCIIT